MIATLKAIRDDLQADPTLSAWYQSHYQKQPRHFIGYKKPVNANDYPALCYVPARERIGTQPFGRLTVSLVVSVSAQDMTDDIFDGVAQSDAVVQLICNRLLRIGGPISIENGEIVATTDLGLRHPFYETELQFTVLVDQAAIDAAGLDDFSTFRADFDIDPHQPKAEHDKWLQEPADYSDSRPELTDSVNLP